MSVGQETRFRWTIGRWARVIGIAVLAGVLGGTAAAAVEFGLHLAVPHLVGRFSEPAGPHLFDLRLAILFLPVLGGLISGTLVAFTTKPVKRGGTEALVHAFHHEGGTLSPVAPGIKALANVIVIAFGGSVGPEGPLAGFTGALGSKLAGVLRLTARERRVFLLAGCAAGVSAMFRCPLGGALFATAIPYREPENEDDALVPSIISAVAAYATFMAFWGQGHPLLHGTERLEFDHPVELVAYAALAALCAGAGAFYSWVSQLAEKLPTNRILPRALAPAAGGLLVGAMACVIPQVMDARYQFLQGALDERLFHEASRPPLVWAAFFAFIVLAKCVASALTVGSGNIGGTLGPSVFIGGATGAALGSLIEAVAPGFFPEHLRAALIPVGMAGILAVTMRVPLAAAVMVSEITGTYKLVVPLLFVATLAYLMGRRFGMNHDQLGSPSDSPAHAGSEIVSLLELTRAGEIADRASPLVVHFSRPIETVVADLGGGLATVFVVDGARKLQGIIGRARLAELAGSPEERVGDARDHMDGTPETIRTTDDLLVALEALDRATIEALPVVDEQGSVVGLMRASMIADVLRKWAMEGSSLFLREHKSVALLERHAKLQNVLGRVPGTEAPERKRVPVDAIGRSLKQCDFRRAYGYAVVAVETEKGELIAPPDPDRPLSPGDVLLVAREAKAAKPLERAATSVFRRMEL